MQIGQEHDTAACEENLLGDLEENHQEGWRYQFVID